MVTDESWMAENGEIVESILGLAREAGVDANLFVVGEVRVVEGNYLPEVVQWAIQKVDVVVGCTYITWVSAYHPTPHGLVYEVEIRVLGLVKRSQEVLTGPHILES